VTERDELCSGLWGTTVFVWGSEGVFEAGSMVTRADDDISAACGIIDGEDRLLLRAADVAIATAARWAAGRAAPGAFSGTFVSVSHGAL
jgi:hypothetical protein